MCCKEDVVCSETHVVRNFVYCVVFSDICCEKDVVVLRHKLFVPSLLKCALRQPPCVLGRALGDITLTHYGGISLPQLPS